MDSTTDSWRDVLALTFDQLLQQLIVFAPKLLWVVALLLAGWVIALVLARLTRNAINILNRIVSRLFPRFFASGDQTIKASYTTVIGRCVFWLVFLFFVAASANSLGLNIVSNWMGQLLLYLPRLAAGLLIMVGGYLASNVVKAMATSTAESAGFKQSELLGTSVQFAVFFTAIVIGVEQLGINIQFFTQFFIVISAVILFGFSLAFGLGAKSLIGNIIGAQQAQKHMRVGDKVVVGETEGVLIELTTTLLVLETQDGRTTVPAHLFLNQVAAIKSQTKSPSE